MHLDWFGVSMRYFDRFAKNCEITEVKEFTLDVLDYTLTSVDVF